jgi:hypothetical protein
MEPAAVSKLSSPVAPGTGLKEDRRSWVYDADPPTGTGKVFLLTDGGTEVVGRWRPNAGYIAWCAIPRRDHVKEDEVRRRRAALKGNAPT